MDQKYMRLALKLALKGEGFVNPNPLVGAVLVKDGEIVGTGYHKFYGGPHAEVYAINMAGEKAEGATLYVTLEPCSHFGKTPPCTAKIIDSKISRCVVAIKDPNPLVSGRGIKQLIEAGIKVEIGILERENMELNRVFLKYITSSVPYLFLKCAITLDGKIATRDGDSKWITNEISREKVQRLRHRYSGIMVGINTLIADNPSLNCRIEGLKNPFRIVVDPNLRIPMDSKILEFEDEKNILVTSYENHGFEKIKSLYKKGVKIIFLSGKKFKIVEILKELGKMRIDSVLLEGGAGLISQAVRENCIDGGEIFIAPKFLGDSQGIPFVEGFSVSLMKDAFQLENTKFHRYGDNISLEFHKNLNYQGEGEKFLQDL
ncbi:MAG: bifunctional diaminohydroxyphosphoribosylaminopyrimidine deaminase/5-amino-6-(5-phosphoribosylamino)uracil reductase RibD [Fusobacteriaceae bacterium]